MLRIALGRRNGSKINSDRPASRVQFCSLDPIGFLPPPDARRRKPVKFECTNQHRLPLPLLCQIPGIEKQKEKWNSQCSFPQLTAGTDGCSLSTFILWVLTANLHRKVPPRTPANRLGVLLEICRNDIHEAQVIAAINVKFAMRREGVLYWSRVQEALVSVEHQLVVAVPPPDWQGTESRAIFRRQRRNEPRMLAPFSLSR